MSKVINKQTGKILESVHTPDYNNDEYIINPTQEEINNILANIVKPVDTNADIIAEIDACTTLDELKDFVKINILGVE
jgi:hypothetical protein